MSPRPSQRSLNWIRKRGYTAAMAERWVLLRPEQAANTDLQRQRKKAGGFRQDLFGFVDVLAFCPSKPGVLAIQATTRNQITLHLKTYRRDAKLRQGIFDFLAAGNRFVIHGWDKTTVGNTTTPGCHVRWELTQREIRVPDLALTHADRIAIESKAEEAAGGVEPVDVRGKTKELFR